jgi:hypothetical protein
MEQAYSDLLFDQKQEIEDKEQEEEAFARSIPAYSILVKIMTSFVQLNSLASGNSILPFLMVLICASIMLHFIMWV